MSAEPPTDRLRRRRRRHLADAGDSCELLAGFELAALRPSSGPAAKRRRLTLARATASSPLRFGMHGGDGGEDHKLLGLDPRDVMPSKTASRLTPLYQ